jgi:hypothetical protein
MEAGFRQVDVGVLAVYLPSAILVHDGRSCWLYTVRPDVRVCFPRDSAPPH